MEKSNNSLIKELMAKINELNLKNVSVKNDQVVDLSGFRREHSLEKENSLTIEGTLDKE